MSPFPRVSIQNFREGLPFIGFFLYSSITSDSLHVLGGGTVSQVYCLPCLRGLSSAYS